MRLKDWNFDFCPFCSTRNHTGSFNRYKKKGTFKCWSCGARGNRVVFFAMMEGVTVEEMETALITMKEMFYAKGSTH